jgi:hypothetical protein
LLEEQHNSIGNILGRDLDIAFLTVQSRQITLGPVHSRELVVLIAARALDLQEGN